MVERKEAGSRLGHLPTARQAVVGFTEPHLFSVDLRHTRQSPANPGSEFESVSETFCLIRVENEAVDHDLGLVTAAAGDKRGRIELINSVFQADPGKTVPSEFAENPRQLSLSQYANRSEDQETGAGRPKVCDFLNHPGNREGSNRRPAGWAVKYSETGVEKA